MPTAEETQLLSYLNRMHVEGRQARDLTDLKDTDTFLDIARGQQWPKNLPKGFIDFTLNLIGDVVQRKASLLTDSRPILQVVSTNKELVHQPKLLEQLLRSIWDEAVWQEELPRAIAMAEVSGSVVGLMTIDHQANGGRGDVVPQVLDARAVVIDPAVIRPTQMPDAEFVISETMRSVASLIEQYGERAREIRPDASLSSMPASDLSMEQGGILSGAFGYFRRLRQGRRTQPTAIARAWERHYWFKDWERYPDDEPMAGQPMWSRPRLIRHVIAAGGVVLRDEPNPFWHGGYPHEILDWGMELEHPWGQSEVKQLRKAQEALNRIASDILKNTVLMNNFKVIMDQNALEPDEVDKLTNRPAILLRKRQGTELRFESPPALPAYLFQLVEFLVRAIEMVSGLSEVTRGQKPGGVQSGIALEGLQLAAQTVIRLQTRRIESWIKRLWDKTIPLCFQVYTHDRVKTIVGPGQELDTFLFELAAFHLGIANPREAFRDFVLHVQPGSSLAATKVQKVVLSGNLFKMGLIPGVEVLRSAEWPDPEGTLAKAKEEHGQAAQARAALRGPQGLGRGRRALQSFPAGGQGAG